MSAFLVGNALLHFETTGRGKPVIFLHNFIGSWRYWLGPMEYLSSSFKGYALDLWGYGDSARIEFGQYTLQRHVEQLADFIDQMGVGQTALVGHGYGALVAQQYAKRFSGRVNRLVSIVHAMPHAAKVGAAHFRSHSWLASQKLPEAVIADCLKADPLAVQAGWDTARQTQPHAPLESMPQNLPHLVITYGDAIKEKSPNKVAMAHNDLFPMEQNPEELQRMLLEFLTGSSQEIGRGMIVKEFWKRRVR